MKLCNNNSNNNNNTINSTNTNTTPTPSNTTSFSSASNSSATASTTAATSPATAPTTATATTNGSLTDSSRPSTDGHRTPNVETLSKTNLYIKGLSPSTRDQDLHKLCSRFGQISSTKAIVENSTGCCRGYGFVEFTTPHAAANAVKELTKNGVQAQMARISPLYSSQNHNQHGQHNHHQHHQHHHHNRNQSSHGHHQHNSNMNNYNHNSGARGGNNGGHSHNHNSSNTIQADPTNLYIANLPPNMSEQELENLLSAFGPVVSTRILRDHSTNIPRGVGFARMESRDKCEEIIQKLNGRTCKPGMVEPLLVKFADGGIKKRQHHNNQHHNNHHNINQQQQHHSKTHQDDTRWRDGGANVDTSNPPNYDPQGNISHSNHLSDLAMMSTMSYSRLQPGFPPTMAGSGSFPATLGPATSAPQWIHPGAPGQPYVIPQQMLQAGSIAAPNQAAAAAAMHYGHIPQLTTQMQSLSIAHPGAPVGGYHLQPHWSALWTHPIPQQSMRLTNHLQPSPSNQQQPQQPQQSSPQPNPATQQSAPASQQQTATDNKIQLPL